MKDHPVNPGFEQPEPRRRRFSLRRFFRLLFLLVVCLAIAFVAVRFGPNIYRRLFGDGNTTWISQRFGEELKAKNELVVYEVSLTGQETAQQNAWLIGKVQEVLVPYTFTLSFTVDLSRANVSVDTAANAILVRLPSPQPKYPKLTVDETRMKKYDLLYPLTPERYAEIQTTIEQKLLAECSAKQEYLDAAWSSAVTNMQTLFTTIAESSEQGVTCEIQVIRDDRLSQPTDTGAPTATLAPAA